MKQKIKSTYQAKILEAKQVNNNPKALQAEQELNFELALIDERFQKSVDCLVE